MGRRIERQLDAVLQGSFWTGVAWSLSLATTLPLVVALVRLLPHREYGVLALATSITTLATAVADFGLRAAVAQLAASRAAREGIVGARVAAAAARRVSLYATVAVVLMVAVIEVGLSAVPRLRPAVAPIAVMSPLPVTAPIRNALTGLLQSEFSVRAVTASSFVQSVTTLSVSAMCLFVRWREPWQLGCARGVAAAIALAYLLRAGERWVARSRASRDSHTTNALVRLSLAMFLGGVAWVAVNQLDVLILGLERGPKLVAFYAPISSIGNVMLTIPSVVGGFLLPALARSAQRRDGTAFAHLYFRASSWCIALSAPAIAVTVVYPRALLLVAFGPAYSKYSVALRILGSAIGLDALLGFNSVGLDAYGVASLVARRAIIGIAVSALACPFLVSTWGITGAALATSAAIIAINLQCSWALLRCYAIAPVNIETLLVAGVAVGSAALVNLVGLRSHVGQVLLCGGIVGAVTFCTVGAFSRWRSSTA